MRHYYQTISFATIASAAALPAPAALAQARSTLQWKPCEIEDLDISAVKLPISCANLAVPLDYSNPDDVRELQLQLLKINATKEPFLGSVLFNPGGPGAAGVEYMVNTGPVYNEYDFRFSSRASANCVQDHWRPIRSIGFDPRYVHLTFPKSRLTSQSGTGRTLPFACALNWTEARKSTDLNSRSELFQTDLISNFHSQGWKDSTYVAEQCYEDNDVNGSFLSTAFVARDTLQVVNALNEDGLLRFWGMYSTIVCLYAC